MASDDRRALKWIWELQENLEELQTDVIEAVGWIRDGYTNEKGEVAEPPPPLTPAGKKEIRASMREMIKDSKALGALLRENKI